MLAVYHKQRNKRRKSTRGNNFGRRKHRCHVCCPSLLTQWACPDIPPNTQRRKTKWKSLNFSGALHRRLRDNYVITVNFRGGRNKHFLNLTCCVSFDANAAKTAPKSFPDLPAYLHTLRLHSDRLGSWTPGSASSAPHEVSCGEAQRTDALPFLFLLILLCQGIPHGCGRMLQVQHNCNGSTGIRGGLFRGVTKKWTLGFLNSHLTPPQVLCPCMITVLSSTKTLFLWLK